METASSINGLFNKVYRSISHLMILSLAGISMLKQENVPVLRFQESGGKGWVRHGLVISPGACSGMSLDLEGLVRRWTLPGMKTHR